MNGEKTKVNFNDVPDFCKPYQNFCIKLDQPPFVYVAGRQNDDSDGVVWVEKCEMQKRPTEKSKIKSQLEQSKNEVPEIAKPLYEIERIVNFYKDKKNTYALVKWVGYPFSMCTWEHAESLPQGVGDFVVSDFKRRLVMCSRINELIHDEHRRRTEFMARKGITFKSADNNNFFHYKHPYYPIYNHPQVNYVFQMRCLQWETEMNLMNASCGRAPLFVENWVDDEAAPEDFYFSLDYVYHTSAKNILTGFPNPAFSKCSKRKHCCKNYFLRQRFLHPAFFDDNLYECSEICGCGPDCRNRVTQKGRQVPLVIFRTVNCGWSVRAAVDMPKGTFVSEYIGEVISPEEMRQRQVSRYMFDIYFDDEKGREEKKKTSDSKRDSLGEFDDMDDNETEDSKSVIDGTGDQRDKTVGELNKTVASLKSIKEESFEFDPFFDVSASQIESNMEDLFFEASSSKPTTSYHPPGMTPRVLSQNTDTESKSSSPSLFEDPAPTLCNDNIGEEVAAAGSLVDYPLTPRSSAETLEGKFILPDGHEQLNSTSLNVAVSSVYSSDTQDEVDEMITVDDEDAVKQCQAAMEKTGGTNNTTGSSTCYPDLIIDSNMFGNEARFFNNSCDPNMIAFKIYSNAYDYRLFRICFFTTKNVRRGEELTFNYYMGKMEGLNNSQWEYQCLCMSENCIGRIG